MAGKAIERTLPFIREKDIWNLAMGRDELMLLILWGEKKKQGKRRIAFMQKALTYMEKQWKDIEEKGKIYPYAAMLLERELIKEKLWQEAEKVGEDAVKLLIDIDSICYLRELLQLQIFVKNELGKTEEAKKFTEEYMILEDICKEYGYIDEKTGILVRLKKQFYVEKEVIRKNRIGRGFTQEQLSEGICEPETLARIEKGRGAHERNFGKLTERLGWRKEKRSTELAIWDFKKLEKKWKIDWLMGHRKFKEARKELELFECGDTLEGRQYLLYMKTMVRVQLGELTYQEALEVFGEALSLTLKNYEKLSFKEYILTRQEMVILNGIALAHIEIGEKERGIEIYEDVLTGCDQSSVKNQHRTTGVLIFMENLPVYLEEMKRYEEALEWHEKAIRLVLKCRRGLLLDKILANKAYVWEKQGRKEEACLQLYKQAYYISILMEDKVIGSGIREHCQKQYGEETWARVISGENNF
ncbi:MAG: tetratricopeptide repeat protein [Acetivibrio ethanolgignens]